MGATRYIFEGSLICIPIPSANSNTLTTFPIFIPLIFSSCLIVLVRTSSIILNSHEENGWPCLSPVFSRIALSFSLFNLVFVVILLYMYIAVTMFLYVPFNPNLSKTLVMNGCEILSMVSQHQIRWSHFFCFFGIFLSVYLYGRLH